MAAETCGICGGDGRIQNSFGGSSKTCPGCHGTGRKAEDFGIFRDVTKTKPSHYQRPAAKGAAAPAKPDWPTTFEGDALAKEVHACATLSNETKAKLTREIMEYEVTHGKCTQTFTKKIKKQLRPATP
ncbi:MAG TPA: molecular chaperone DnaJ [Minicystis sp.]|nr:molecular chaperone DnaJ [Minicystis sp.]